MQRLLSKDSVGSPNAARRSPKNGQGRQRTAEKKLETIKSGEREK